MFRNYIYLSPTGNQLYGFDIYRFLQGNANLYGSEITLHIKPLKQITFESSFSNVTGKLASGKYLPFIPANKLVADFVFKHKAILEWKTGIDYVFAQKNAADFETSTAKYWLLHTSLSLTRQLANRLVRFGLNGNNLLNKVYYDHLSRFKYFGIYNTGLNIAASINISFNKNNNKL